MARTYFSFLTIRTPAAPRPVQPQDRTGFQRGSEDPQRHMREERETIILKMKQRSLSRVMSAGRRGQEACGREGELLGKEIAK